MIINDPSNSAAVIVDDSGFAGSNTYTVTSTQVAASVWPNFLLIYNNPASLTLNGGSGADRFNIESTAGTTATTINDAGSGGDRFAVAPTNQYLAAIPGRSRSMGPASISFSSGMAIIPIRKRTRSTMCRAL